MDGLHTDPPRRDTPAARLQRASDIHRCPNGRGRPASQLDIGAPSTAALRRQVMPGGARLAPDTRRARRQVVGHDHRPRGRRWAQVL